MKVVQLTKKLVHNTNKLVYKTVAMTIKLLFLKNDVTFTFLKLF